MKNSFHTILFICYLISSIYLIPTFISEDMLREFVILEQILLVVLIFWSFKIFWKQSKEENFTSKDWFVKENIGNNIKFLLEIWAIKIGLIFDLGAYIELFILIGLLVIYSLIILGQFSRKKGVSVGSFLALLILLSWSRDVYTLHFGNNIIGSFWSNPDYTTDYEVEASPEDSDIEYDLIANIDVYNGVIWEYMDAEFYQFLFFKRRSNDRLSINRLYFPNGGSIEIESCSCDQGSTFGSISIEECEILDGNGIDCMDEEENWWTIKLKNPKE